ncbi:MAG: phosphotransferase [Rhodospirillaceae bacterium]|jgi:fructosamine-3-kinase|nr:phosphotransferase [Rhodospirillaceae bacterium]MBT5374225.1 phosphotransferase [Rhodospirillaceae bacterium]MBT5659112.1 phosphotransferase [Rhodospirillaceae bacterium]MBT5753239.1 phosphotransferase [Rhodospirillaceae bacterium]
MVGAAKPQFLCAIENIIGETVANATPLGGGCVGEVYRIDLSSGERLVAKIGNESSDPDGGLALEGWMLETLKERSRLPVPTILHAADSLLLMEYIEGGDEINEAAQEHAAELLADLHGVTAPQFGLEKDTLIGGLAQPNPPSDCWPEFFRDHRLLYMGHQAMAAGRLPGPVMDRLERFAARIKEWIGEVAEPALIHGDMWGGNVLARKGRIAGFVDPAIYYADPEIELAFSTLFSTFGEAFFRRYQEIRPIAPGFFEERRDIYNLYPLLVHVRLFGSGYVGGVEGILTRFGT